MIDRISRMMPDASDPAGMYLVGSAACGVWAFDLSLGSSSRPSTGCAPRVGSRLLAQALTAQAWAAVHLAREALAVSAAEEAAGSRGDRSAAWAATAQLAQAAIAARARRPRGRGALAREAEALLLPMVATPMLALAQFARGRGAVAHQLYAEGFEHHRRMLDPTDPAYHPAIGAWGLSDLVEAAAHSGNETAKAYLEQLESSGGGDVGSLLRATAGYARPMVAGRRGCGGPLPDGARARPRQLALLPGPDVALYGRGFAAGDESLTRARPCGGAGSLRRACLPSLGRERSPGAPRRRRDEPSPSPRPGITHAAGAPDRPYGGRGPVEPRDRTAALHLAQDGRLPPAQDLPEARNHLPRPARTPRR